MASYNALIASNNKQTISSSGNVIGDDSYHLDNNNSSSLKFSDNRQQQSDNWEYEEITLSRGSCGLGFTVAGGVDYPHHENDNSIYITRFVSNGPAVQDGRLKIEDIIVRVDNTELIDVNHADAVNALKNSSNRVQLLIKRKKQNLSKSFDEHQNHEVEHHTNNITNSFKGSNNITNLINKYQQAQQLDKEKSSFQKGSVKNSTNAYNYSPNTSTLPPLPTKQTQQSNSSLFNSSFPPSLPKIKTASSSLSLQQQQTRLSEDDGLPAHSLNRENNNYKSTSAINDSKISRGPRTVILQRTTKGLGFNIVGGITGTGTFISYIVAGGSAERSKKLHRGDQIMSVNGVDLRHANHEEAASTLKQSGQTVKLVVKYRPEEFAKFENQINDMREMNMLSSGTLKTSQKRSLYARALFDYDPSRDSGLPSRGLSFKFGEVLHIINASDDEWWQARKVLENGKDDTVNGIIPSSKKLEKREKSRLKSVKFNEKNCSESTLDRRRKKISFFGKFPFMKLRENLGADYDEYNLNGSRSNSRGILSSSIMSINNASEKEANRNGSDEAILSYEPVLLHEINYKRPVALYGLKEEIDDVRENLACDSRYPFYKMELVVPYTSRPRREGELDGVKYHFVTKQEMERDLAANKFVEAGKLKDNLYGTSIESIREVAESGKHCLLNIGPNAIKRLRDAGLYPIVILIKPKSVDLLLEMNKRWSQSDAIAAMEYCQNLEQAYGSYFTATITFDNISADEIYNEVLKIIEQQSHDRIWIPTTYEKAING